MVARDTLKTIPLFALAAALAVMAGCSTNRLVACMSASVFRQGIPALEREPDPVLAEQTAPVMIKMT